jgi:hypothetical protein
MQRRKTCPSCGEEIGLKAGSQPVGIRPWERVRAGDSGGAASSSGRLAGFVIGRRSPLWVRSTATRPCAADNPAPVVGNEGNTIRAVVNNASENTPTMLARRAVVPHIGSLRSVCPTPHVPNARSTKPATARTSNVLEVAWFHCRTDRSGSANAHSYVIDWRAKPGRDHSTWNKRGVRWRRNKHCLCGLL